MVDAGWTTDPTGRHQHRYHDGTQWTDHVADNGVQAEDPYTAVPPLPPAAAQTPSPPRAEADGSSGIPFFGAKKVAQRLTAELDTCRAERDAAVGQRNAAIEERDAVRVALAKVDGLTLIEVQEKLAATQVDLDSRKRVAEAALNQLDIHLKQREATLAELQEKIVATEDIEILQEAGVYDYRHPLTDAVAYQIQLKELQGSIKTMARANGGAVTGAANWTVNGSLPQGRKMVNETSKLMLRAYNAEADNLVRGLKPFKRDAAIARLDKVFDTIQRLGRTMSIEISRSYHKLRVTEIELTADYLAKKEEEKEREREERLRLREERVAQQEIERERQRLEKEQAHHRNALAALEDGDDAAAADRVRQRLAEIDKAIEDVDYRAANIRAGYVYVISNIGAFGPEVVKIGMTRRLDPQDRVRELGDASVPFRYDTHALFFAQDAVAIENALHKSFAEQRINKVNLRREFFRTTPAEVKTRLADLAGELLEFTDVPEALEYRQSQGVTVL